VGFVLLGHKFMAENKDTLQLVSLRVSQAYRCRLAERVEQELYALEPEDIHLIKEL